MFKYMIDNKILNDEEIEKKLKKYTRKDFPHTREYLVNQLRLDSNFQAPKGILCKLDIMEMYEKVRIESNLEILDYDWSLVPEFIYSQYEKFTLVCNEVDINGNKIGEYITDYKQLIIRKANPIQYSFYKLQENRIKDIHKNNFYEWIKENRPEIKIVSEYKGASKEIWVECPIHGKYKTTPNTLRRKSRWTGEYAGNCPECDLLKYNSQKRLKEEDFLKRAREIHGNRYEYPDLSYKNERDTIKIYDTMKKEYFYQTPHEHLAGHGNNKNKSIGEEHIVRWLKENNIFYLRDEPIEPLWEGDLFGKKSGIVKLDFVFNDGGLLYWIEYNGIQHYQYSPRFHKTVEDFFNQVRRDQNIRDYVDKRNSKRRQIVYIEIPYTYKTYKDVKDLLDEIVFNLKPTSIINQEMVIIPKDMMNSERR